MDSDNKPNKCSGCGCSFKRDEIVQFLNRRFTPNVSDIILTLANPANTYRVIHKTETGVHCVCPSCELDILDRLCMMCAGSFTCPHSGCQRLIIAG